MTIEKEVLAIDTRRVNDRNMQNMFRESELKKSRKLWMVTWGSFGELLGSVLFRVRLIDAGHGHDTDTTTRDACNKNQSPRPDYPHTNISYFPIPYNTYT